jgi:hypothetical protein
VGRKSLIALAIVLFALPALADATVTMNVAVSGVTVMNPFSITCTDTTPDAIFFYYLDDKYIPTAKWPVTATPGPHYLLCNAYVNNVLDGSVAETVTVVSPTSAKH